MVSSFIAEEHPAAMQDGRNDAPFTRHSPALVVVVVFLLVLAHLETTSACSQPDISVHNRKGGEWFGGKNSDFGHNDAFENEVIGSLEGQVAVPGSENGISGPSGKVVALVKGVLETSQEDQERIVSLLVNEIFSNSQKNYDVSCGLLYKNITEQEVLDDFQTLALQNEGSALKMSQSPTVTDEQFSFYPNSAFINENSSRIQLNNDYSTMSLDQNPPVHLIDVRSASFVVINPDHQSTTALNLLSPMVFPVQLISR